MKEFKESRESRERPKSPEYTFRVERLNSEGITRRELTFALTQPKFVLAARRLKSCLLCRNGPVNESGLCESCFALLNDEEFRLAQRWLTGEGPPGA